ncbi:hypothetical protein G3I40_03910 [Streptomyces sp. SID14478]|uniref:hypothetical protein n=1 Tax=Streptomyces sp. SID14478 TaxID=2706073 RepID=UPI0013DB661E|nr:hypothetical protein [Streptomyces sp. SID14478]
MDVTTLALLGGAGGLLRGAVDFYARFTSWRVDRLAHRQLVAAGAAQATPENRPRFPAYFDPSVDVAAAFVHCLLGAGTAALLGRTGQINGEYAAVVVGMSAPMLLTQLSRIQTVNEAVTGNWQQVGAEAPETGTTPSAGAPDTMSSSVEAETASTPSAGAPPAIAPSESPPRTLPAAEPAAPTADPARPTPRLLPSPRSAAAGADACSHEPTPRQPPAHQPQLRGDASHPEPPAVDGTTSGLDDPGRPRWRQGPTTGEEGL